MGIYRAIPERLDFRDMHHFLVKNVRFFYQPKIHNLSYAHIRSVEVVAEKVVEFVVAQQHTVDIIKIPKNEHLLARTLQYSLNRKQ